MLFAMKYKPFRIELKLWLRIEIFEKSQFCNKIKKIIRLVERTLILLKT